MNNADDYNDDLDLAVDGETIELQVPNDLAGKRLDAALAQLLPDYSRSRITTWIKDGLVIINGAPAQPKHKLIGSEKVSVTIVPSVETAAFIAEDIDLDVVYEDDTVIVINKPAGLVVHPAAGNWTGTLLNGLLFHYPELSQVPRAGIVHRLDKDTSGLMVVAKTLPAQNHLVQQLQGRTVKRIYRAVCNGIVPFDGKIDTKIGRDPHNRLKMAVVKFGGKQAITHIKVLERYLNHSYVECALETGRTHQIRVHMQHLHHPLVADAVYGGAAEGGLQRQALHAFALQFVHPITGQDLALRAPPPDDFLTAAEKLGLQYNCPP